MGSLLTLIFPASVLHVSAAPSYNPGVKSGDEVTYGNVTGFWRSNATRSLTPAITPQPSTSFRPNATIAVQPNATVDLARTLKQITVELALINTPDVPPFNGVLVQLSYDTHVLTAASLNYSTNVFAGYTTAIVADCLDGHGANGNSGLCHSDDGPGITTFAQTILGAQTPDGTQGSIFFLTFNVNTTAPHFSQIAIKQGSISNGNTAIAVTLKDGYYTSLNCGGVVCSAEVANFTWSPKPAVQGAITVFDGSSSLPTPGAHITDYAWAFGDSGIRPYIDTGTNSMASYIYLIAGNYSVTLAITDSNGIKTSKTQLVFVVNPNPTGAPPLIAEFLHVQSVHVGVLSVSGSQVTASQAFTFNNGTSPRTFLLSGNVATGSGNLTFWILSSGLRPGDPIYNAPSPTINRTDTEFFGGAPRQVVRLSFAANGGNIFQNWAWDQATGVLVSFETGFFLQNSSGLSSGYANATITSTNLWSSGDFVIQANPTSLTIHKSNSFDPFATGVSTITLTSLSGFSGTVQLQAGSTGFLGLTFSSVLVGLTSNGTAISTLTISAANTDPGIYFVTVTGSQFTGPVLQHSVTITVQVVAPPPDFQIYLYVPFGGNFVFAGSSTSIGVQLSSNGASTFNGVVSLTGQVSPLANNGPTLSFNPAMVTLTSGYGFSQLTVSTMALTPPGNYTIIVTGTSGSLVHTAQFQLTVARPPVLTLSPSSGPIGTQVTIHGSGFVSPFQGPFSQVELQITFDDQLVGFFVIQGSSFNFTFDVPVAQAGIIHLVHAKELFPSILDVQAGFLVQPQPNGLTVTISPGTVYFPGDTATTFVTTNLNGQPTTVTSLQVVLILPTGSNLTLRTVLISTGFYKATFLVPTTGSIGTYAVIVKAHQTGSGDGSALGGFEVKRSWLQANGQNVITATALVGTVGALGVLGLTRRTGYFARKREESM